MKIWTVLAALLLLPAAPAAAQGLTFNATLGSVRLTAAPGDVHTRQFQLSLPADQPRAQFRAHLEDWWRSEDGTQSFYAAPGTLRQSCATWATVNPVEASVGPGETLTVRYTIAVPEDVPAAGYWCALTIDQVPDPAVSQPGIGVQFLASVSTGVFVDVGAVMKAANIADLAVADGQALVSMRNAGNTPLAVEGRIEFRAPGQDSPVASVAVPRNTLLPEPITTGVFGVPLPPPESLPDGRYLVRAVMDIGVDHYIGAEREANVTRGAASRVPDR